MPSASPLPLLLACQAVIAAFASSQTLASALPPSTTSTKTKSKPPTHKSLITKKRAAAFPKTKKPFPKRTKAADLPLPFPRHPSRPAAVFSGERVSHLLPDEDEYDEYDEDEDEKRMEEEDMAVLLHF